MKEGPPDISGRREELGTVGHPLTSPVQIPQCSRRWKVKTSTEVCWCQVPTHFQILASSALLVGQLKQFGQLKQIYHCIHIDGC